MKSANKNSPSLEELLDNYSDSYNCNLKEKALVKCFNELDKTRFFKKRKYNKCLQLEKEFNHCLIYANQNSLNKRTFYQVQNTMEEIYDRNSQIKLENKIDAYAFVTGQKTEEEILSKQNQNVRKKIIEL